jgi:dienelactone hydrolase
MSRWILKLPPLVLGGFMTACFPLATASEPKLRATSEVVRDTEYERVALTESPIHYRADGLAFESYYVAPQDSIRGGVIFGPDWYGVYDYPIAEARRLARLGFAVLVADVYGAGLRPKNDAEAGQLFGQLHTDRAALRARGSAALRELVARLPNGVSVSAFGFSMGGMTVLELARSGATLTGVVVLSGILDNPTPADAANIRAPVHLLHGTEDAFAPLDQVAAFAREMDAAKRPFQVELYGGAAHAFTNPNFANVSDGPLRYSPTAGPRADAAALTLLTAWHPLPG